MRDSEAIFWCLLHLILFLFPIDNSFSGPLHLSAKIWRCIVVLVCLLLHLLNASRLIIALAIFLCSSSKGRAKNRSIRDLLIGVKLVSLSFVRLHYACAIIINLPQYARSFLSTFANIMQTNNYTLIDLRIAIFCSCWH